MMTLCIYEISALGKSKETESILVVARETEDRRMGNEILMSTGLFSVRGKIIV